MFATLDRDRTSAAMGSAIVWPPISHPRAGRISQWPHPKPLRRFNRVIQEPRKGGFSKGGFCRVQCHGQVLQNSQGYWPQQYIWHSERHSQERRIFCQNPLQKTPFSWSLSNGGDIGVLKLGETYHKPLPQNGYVFFGSPHL